MAPMPAGPHLPGTILVIDDDPAILALLNKVLTRAGFQVRLAAAGEAGLKLLETEPIDLLLTDKNLPGMNGLDVLREAKARYPALPVILITAYPTVETRGQAEALGAFGYIDKPFGILETLAMCVDAIGQSRRRA